MKQLEFTIKYNKLQLFINALKELSKLDENSLLRIDNKRVLLYSLVGQNKNINAFRSFNFITSEIFTMTEIEDQINFIISDNKNFIKTINNLLDFEKDIKCKMSYDDINNVYYGDKITMQVPKQLKLNFVGGEPVSMNTTISYDDIEEYVNIDNSLFSFDMKKEQFDKVKKLSLLDTKNDVLYINVVNDDNDTKSVKMSEIRWDLSICETLYDDNIELCFPKKYFKNIAVNNDFIIYVFDSFILIKEDVSTLLISIENNG